MLRALSNPIGAFALLATACCFRPAAGVPPDSIAAVSRAADTLSMGPRRSRVVQMHEILVQSTRLHDPYSSETVHMIPSAIAATLPVDRISDLFALQPGVVVQGGDLHVRGGRSGESRVVWRGIDLGDPLTGRALELPLEALADAELLSGGLDADEGGALAGVLRVRTVDPGASWGGRVEWHTDGRTGSHYDRAGARIGGPVPGTGLGVEGSFEATLDDGGLPDLRTERRSEVLGSSFGWRANNRLLGHLKVATAPTRSRFTLELAANRSLIQPYDPSWSLDGYTISGSESLIDPGPRFSPTPLPGFDRYRAADHLDVTDDRRAVGVVSWEQLAADSRLAIALGWLGARQVTSLDGGDNQDYLAPVHAPTYGLPDSHFSDPFHVYQGDEPYFGRFASQRWTLRADQQRVPAPGDLIKLGAGLTYDQVAVRELDVSMPHEGIDSLRSFDAFAPGGWAYAHVRWAFEGMVANGGLRAEYFTAGPQADRQSLPGRGGGVWSLSPRLGVAYPVSTRDVFSLSYVRLAEDPPRAFLYDNRLAIMNREPLGNPALAPATAIEYQAAVKHVIDARWAMQGAVFYRDVVGLPGARNLQPPSLAPRLQYQDLDEASASGFEYTVLWSGLGGAHGQLSYTYLQAVGTASSAQGVPYGPELGARPASIAEHPLDWDRRHTFDLALHWERPRLGSLSWTTIAGSGLPWTPRERRTLDANLADENTARFGWSESSSLDLRLAPRRWLGGLALGLEVRNVFDERTDLAATVDGYPNPEINTLYDDYGAYRTETGRPGGAYWNDHDGDGLPGWVPVHDPRLIAPPRIVRIGVTRDW